MIIWPIFFLICCLSGVATGHNGAVALIYPMTGVEIDGEFDDWPAGADRFPIDLCEHGVEPRNAEDFSGFLRLGYDRDRKALYVAAEVRDESLLIDAELAEKPWIAHDGCELFIDVGHGESWSPLLQFMMYGSQRRIFGAKLGSEGDLDDVEVAMQTAPGVRRYEWRLNLDRISQGRWNYRPEVVLGFDIALIDKDEDGSYSWMTWGHGSLKAFSLTRLGDAIFLESGEEIADEAVGLFQKVLGQSVRTTLDRVWETTTYQIFFSSVPLAFSMLHLVLFLFYPRIKENLYYALFTGSLAIFIFIYFQRSFSMQPDLMYGVLAVPIAVSLPFGLRFLYAVFYSRLPRVFWLFILGGLGTILWWWYSPLSAITYLNFFALAVAVEIARVLFQGRAQKKQGTWIIGTGMVFFLITMAAQVLMSFGISHVFVWGLLGISVSMSVHLSRSFARTNLDLEAQLVRVKELSARALEQERIARREEVQRRMLEAENERKTQELEEARALQLSMLPQAIPELDDVEIAWYMNTATEVGGDYYDYAIDPDGTLTVALGDATGHGLKSGTVVTATKSLFHAQAMKPCIEEIFRDMSTSLHKMNMGRMGMAMVMVKVREGRLRMGSAGIPPVLLFRRATGEVEEVLIEGMPLGLSSSPTYQEREFPLDPGDAILLMSDGLPELLNAEGEEFGYPRTAERFSRCATEHPAEICRFMALGGDEWANGASQDDDMTFIALQIKSPIPQQKEEL
jgi:serine phosphatase RsbU (regulator of sigma subunit)